MQPLSLLPPLLLHRGFRYCSHPRTTRKKMVVVVLLSFYDPRRAESCQNKRHNSRGCSTQRNCPHTKYRNILCKKVAIVDGKLFARIQCEIHTGILDGA